MNNGYNTIILPSEF